MFGAPGTVPEFGHKLTREAAEQVARNWWVLLAAKPDQARLASAGS
jgi:hypothetical protein